MAIGIENYDNISGADSDFPNGNIRDNNGSGNGTPFNKKTYADMHQLLAKLLREAAINASGNAESEYNGFQYLEALRKLLRVGGTFTYVDGVAASTVVNEDWNVVLVYLPTAGSGQIASLGINDDLEDHGKAVKIINLSGSTINVVSAEGYPVNFNSAGTHTLAAGATKTYVFDGQQGPQWVGG